MSREYPTQPIVGAGAVVLEGETVLLVRRGGEPLAGQWSLPGGRLELGETVEQAIVREVREETSLDVEPLQFLGVYDLIDRDVTGAIRYHYVLVDWICTVSGGELRAGDDATEVCWVQRGDLPRYALAGFTLDAIEKAFRMIEAVQA
ncbi:MAG TPA: NUDIX hydrolase [Acidobacteriaceae bacterium]|nr:NUDIX hydrolase [Acidobacteriaceae bacterium]